MTCGNCIIKNSFQILVLERSLHLHYNICRRKLLMQRFAKLWSVGRISIFLVQPLISLILFLPPLPFQYFPAHNMLGELHLLPHQA
nr:MAG TPA: hypothetical protein [Caudoviricetes sp.]